jgi:hypothetical protein
METLMKCGCGNYFYIYSMFCGDQSRCGACASDVKANLDAQKKKVENSKEEVNSLFYKLQE